MLFYISPEEGSRPEATLEYVWKYTLSALCLSEHLTPTVVLGVTVNFQTHPWLHDLCVVLSSLFLK